MIDVLLRALLIGGGAYVGGKLGEKYLSGSGEIPVWNGQLADTPGSPVLVLTQAHHHGKRWYRIHTVTEDQLMQVAACWTYPEAVQLILTWQRYIADGGTVTDWAMANRKRRKEVDALEALWQAT